MDSISKKSRPVTTAPIMHPHQDNPSQAYFASPVTRHRTRKPSLHAQPVQARRFPWKILFFITFFGILGWCGYFAWKIYRISYTIQVSSQDDTNQTKASTLKHIQSLAVSLITPTHTQLKGEAEGRINILLLGRAGEHHPGRDLTDTVMIMSIDTHTQKIALLSLPRDLYVKIPDTPIFTKINAVYQQGITRHAETNLIEKTVANITGLPIHYSFIIDFDGFEKVIDALGGVNIEVMRDMYDPRYPGPNYSYETFEIKKGWQMLNGATALKYVRERHNDPEGDFGRAKRQQQVIQAVKNKAFSLKTFVDGFALNNLLTILGESIKTTIAPEEIGSFIALSKQVDTNNISNVVIDAWKPDSLLRVSHVMVGPTRMFTLVPRVGNYGEIQDIAENLFDINALKRREEAMIAENASITIVNQSSNPQLTAKVKKILQESFGFNQVRIKTNTPTDALYDSTESKQDDSFIIDNTGTQKPFSLDELLKKFPFTLKQESGNSMQGDDTPSDFVIILGNNLGKDLDFEEDSVDDFKKAEDDNISYPKDMTP